MGRRPNPETPCSQAVRALRLPSRGALFQLSVISVSCGPTVSMCSHPWVGGGGSSEGGGGNGGGDR